MVNNIQSFLSENFNVLETWSTMLVIKDDDQNQQFIHMFNSLMDKVESGEHSHKPLADMIKSAILKYEEKYEFEDIYPAEILRSLMKEHGHTQQYLENMGIAPRTVISNILNNRRSINLNQIKRLSKLYNINPAVFIEL